MLITINNSYRNVKDVSCHCKKAGNSVFDYIKIAILQRFGVGLPI